MAEWDTVYVPAHFSMTDEQVATVLARMGSAELVTHHPGQGLVATNLPFQETMSRFGSTGARTELLRAWFFDILHADGVDLLDEPLSLRRERLRAVMSARVRLNTSTRLPGPPCRCTWIRAPSSLTSTDASSGASASSASVGLAEVAASIGSTGTPTVRPTRVRSAPVSATKR